MPTGTVKWFNSEKGYGFIVPEDPGKDIFVHITAVRSAGMDTLAEGQRLAFELSEVRDGKVAATDLRTLD